MTQFEKSFFFLAQFHVINREVFTGRYLKLLDQRHWTISNNMHKSEKKNAGNIPAVFPMFLCLCDLGITYSLKSFNLEIQGTIQKVTKRVLYSSMLLKYTSKYTFTKYTYIYFQFKRYFFYENMIEHFAFIRYC